MKKNNYIIPRNKYEAYEKYMKTLRLVGQADEAKHAIYPNQGKIVLNLDKYLTLHGCPEVVQIPDFVDEVV